MQPYFVAIELIWQLVDLRNGKTPIQQGPYIFDVPFFNPEVIREAINNAVAHRDYRKTSEIVIKQFPHELHIVNPGGFPLGVTLENLLTVNSTPRNRLLADVLAKVGAVERSGQGIDKIYYQTLSEGKPTPDYSKSDNYQVELRLSSAVEDKAFAIFVRDVQEKRGDSEKLSVREIIALSQIRKDNANKPTDTALVAALESAVLLEKLPGNTPDTPAFRLAKKYFEFSKLLAENENSAPLKQEDAIKQILAFFENNKSAKISDFENLFKDALSRDQIKYIVEKLCDGKILKREGKGNGTHYEKRDTKSSSSNLLNEALNLEI